MPLESSPGNSEAEVVQTEASTPDVKPAEASTAEPKSAKGGMLEAVQAALKPAEPEKPLASDKTDPKPEEAKPDADKEKAEGEEDSDEFSEEELSHLKAKTRKRFEKLTKERGELLTKVQDLAPAAEGFQRIVKFVEDNQLAPQEVNQLFEVGASLKNAPRKAYEQIKPIWEKLDAMFGNGLPDDLRQKVAQGYMTEEDARQFARHRTDATLAEQRETQRREREQKQAEAQSHQAHVDTVKAAITGWESSHESKDPDWKLKSAAVQREIRLVLTEQGFPKSKEDAVRIADEALKTVNSEFKNILPKRQEVRPNAPADAASTRSNPAKPGSALEAVRAGLARGS